MMNLLVQVLDGWVGNTILITNWRALLLFFLILRLNSLLDSWFSINSTQFKAKVGIPMLLSEVIEGLAVVSSDGLSEGLVNDVLGEILQVAHPIKYLIIFIIVAVCIIKYFDEAFILNILYHLNVLIQLLVSVNQGFKVG
jgi:hypothetical protein